jgi:hypothetical protein
VNSCAVCVEAGVCRPQDEKSHVSAICLSPSVAVVLHDALILLRQLFVQSVVPGVYYFLIYPLETSWKQCFSRLDVCVFFLNEITPNQ